MNTLDMLLDTGAEILIKRQQGKTVVAVTMGTYACGVYTREDCSVADLLAPGDFIDESLKAVKAVKEV